MSDANISNRRLFYWSLTSALAGFLFGFDTVVISGAEQTIQHLWNLSAGVHGIAMGAALYGTVLGSVAGSWPADRFGRRPTLLAIGVTVLLTVHVFVNIAMTIGLVPITGIPLPFISYGGTFVLSCCLLQGLVQSVYRFRRDF